ncbi:thiamine/thiamine pyrophosphate ABC transporter permease [Marinobacter sp. JSM 1782161]|uniref:thiamine/thiamine pyrophosphate ABC transporter permease n=1 Tax=Marinobacter sp. JSM 1782161 TaxID=2685906 RepID=UPI002B1BD5BE|nr:thiamine/thiamine pyrophosphate ABC transporter permease [Marinobacter sp. JSM 1782161]
MAQRDRTMTPPLSHPRWQIWPGRLVALLLLGIVAAGFFGLMREWRGAALTELWQSAYLRQVIWFSVYQAALSTLLSLLLAIPVARALHRQPRLFGRGLILRLSELSLVLPSIVAAFGLVAVYGRSGWLSPVFDALGGWTLYGLQGILLAHVFFNAPLAARILLQGLERIPANQWRLAAQYGLGSRALWRSLEWPALRQVLPGLAVFIFILCFTSFAIVMTLGGGPRSTTIEVAIYQSLRYDFDFARAAVLALVQLLICGSLWWLATRYRGPSGLVPGQLETSPGLRRDARGLAGWRDRTLLALFLLFLLLPLAAVVWKGLPELWTSAGNTLLWSSLLRSVLVATAAAGMSLGFGLAILGCSRHERQAGHGRRARLTEACGHLTLLVPALVLGTGLFILLRPQLGQGPQGLTLVALINALMALPFVLQVLRGPLATLSPATSRLADQLDVRGLYRLRWIVLPLLRRPILLALAYAAGLSLGDFSVVALFGSPANPTLPLLLYQQLAGYQMANASATALVMLLLLLLVFHALNRLSRAAHRKPQQRSFQSRRYPIHA